MRSDGPDHGHVVFQDGYEMEFGWSEPTPAQIERAGSFYQAVVQTALDWANQHPCSHPTYTESDIVRVWLAG